MPRLSGLKGVTALLAITCLAGCETAKSANPTAPSVAGPIPGVNISAPKPLEPYTGSTLTFTGEPQTLLIENAGSSGARAIYLQVEVATDDQFRTLVHQADRISPGSDGRTTYQLPAALSAGYTYYWHTRALDGANTGPYSATYNFAVVPPVTIDPPFAQAPSGTITSSRPEFKAVNGAIFHTTGVTYRFEVAKDAGFTQMVAVVTVPVNGSGTTSMTIGDMPFKTTFYWRVRGSDGSKESNWSNTATFTIAEPAPVAPPPGQSTGGTPGGVPTGPGGRAADPSGGRLPLPSNGFTIVQAVAKANPGALMNSCQDSGGSWQFMDQVVDTLRTYDTRWGYNGKRGNANDPSKDVITYHYGPGPDANSTDVYIIDIIGGHCGANPTPVWNDVTEATLQGNTIGRWISRGRF
jgi:hypothetical protein